MTEQEIAELKKVNENLLNEVNAVNQQNKELIVKNIDLYEQLRIGGVSQQRELLVDFLTDYYECFGEESEIHKIKRDVDSYLKLTNCG